MKRIITLLIIFTLYIQGCKTNIIDPYNDKSIEGIWKENYEHVIPPWETIDPGQVTIPGKTEIMLSKKEALIKILPFKRVLQFDSTGYKSIIERDTLFIGKYNLKKDTLIFYVKGYNNQENFKIRYDSLITLKYGYYFNNDSLEIKSLPSATDSFAVAMADWLWNGSFLKTKGKFARVK